MTKRRKKEGDKPVQVQHRREGTHSAGRGGSPQKTKDQDQIQTRPSPSGSTGFLFPKWTPYLMSLITLAFRVYHVIDPSNWWVLHPDEIFQSMEVAHSELYGYGLRPYEFNPPGKGDNLSHYQLRELNLGMYALRSPIMPQYMVLITWLAHTFGLDTSNPYLVFRLGHIALTSLLPLAASKLARVTTNSQDVAALTSILIASSAYLHLIGTHTLINSFVSPSLFFGLAGVISLIQFDRSNTVTSKSSTISNSTAPGSGKLKRLLCRLRSFDLSCTRMFKATLSPRSGSINKLQNLENIKNNQPENHNNENGSYAKFEMNNNNQVEYDKNSQCFTHSSSIHDQQVAPKYANGNVVHDHTEDADVSRYLREAVNGDVNNPTRDDLGEHDQSHRNSDASKSTQAFGETLQTYFKDAFYGLILVIAVYIRPDTALLVSLVLLCNLKFSSVLSIVQSRRFLCIAVGGVLGIVLGACNDVIFYDSLTLTPINWVKLNVVSGLASNLFGTSETLFYVHNVFTCDAGMCAGSILFISAFVACIYNSLTYFLRMSQNRKEDCSGTNGKYSASKDRVDTTQSQNSCVDISDRLRRSFHRIYTHNIKAHFLCVTIITVIYSCIGHKEERFLHDTVVIFFVMISELILKLVNFFFPVLPHEDQANCRSSEAKNSTSKAKGTSSRNFYCIILLSGLFMASQIYKFHIFMHSPDKRGMYSSSPLDLDTSKCLYFLSTERDVTGVFIDQGLQGTGGYSLLHKNVPLIYPLGQDFLEFVPSSLHKTRWECVLGENEQRLDSSLHNKGCEISFYSLQTVSDLIHKDNWAALVRKIIGDPNSTSSCLMDQNGHDGDVSLKAKCSEQTKKSNNFHHIYNYAIISAGKAFLEPVFQPVHKTASMWVWRRVTTPQVEAELQKVIKRLRNTGLGSSGKSTVSLQDIIEYEGEVLKQMGNYWAALARFESLAKGSKVKVEVLASLAFCYYRMGNQKQMQKVLRLCLAKYPRDPCLDGGRPRVLNLGERFRPEA